jgi:argininosuccinate synthase
MLLRREFTSSRLLPSPGPPVSPALYSHITIELTYDPDENLFHISYEAGILEDPDTTPPADMWKLTQGLDKAPSTPERITITFTKGIPTTLLIHPEGTGPTPSKEGREITDSVEVFLALNALARKHGIGRCDIVENRFIGVKSRGCYESPAATILRKAHMDLEGLTMDRNVRALRDNFVTVELSKILYNGYWFSPEREFVQSCLEKSQETVNGRVRLALIWGNVIVEGRVSDTEVGRNSLFEIESRRLMRRFRPSTTLPSPRWTRLVTLSPPPPLDVRLPPLLIQISH